jgi:hypothetical protein
VLAQRSWTYQVSPLDLTSWSALASGVTSATPFAYLAPTDTLGYQQLTVTLSAGKDANSETFTALNSDRTTGQNYCGAVRSVTP